MKASKEHKPQQSRIVCSCAKSQNNHGIYKQLLFMARASSPKDKIELCHKAIALDNKRKAEDFYKFMTKNPNRTDKYGFSDNKYWIRWPAFCTGDLPSMSVAILSGFRYGINICNGNNVTAESKIPEVCSYLGAIADPKDKRFIINNDGWVATCNHRTSSSIKFSWLTRVVATGEYYDDKKPNNKLKGNVYDDGVKKQIRSVWLGKDNQDANISTWLRNKGIEINTIKDKKTIVLWIRKSGERGGAHPENDTSIKALRNYINASQNNIYILAGDKKGNKTTLLAQEANVIDLTEFWKDPSIKIWGGDTRTGQLRLYDYFNRICKDLEHIGSMSGGLEALALIGHNVKFKAKSGEVGVTRMEQYKNNKYIKYERIDYEGNHRYFDYKGFEKSFAKYYAFFSSGVINGTINQDEAYVLYEKFYNPHKDYKIKGGGLNGINAQVALKVSKKLAKNEKEQIIHRIREENKQQRLYEQMISQPNINRVKFIRKNHY